MKLTPRQRDVAVQLGQGYSPSQIARALEVKVTTVYTHIEAVADRLSEPMNGRKPSRVVAVWAARNLAA